MAFVTSRNPIHQQLARQAARQAAPAPMPMPAMPDLGGGEGGQMPMPMLPAPAPAAPTPQASIAPALEGLRAAMQPQDSSAGGLLEGGSRAGDPSVGRRTFPQASRILSQLSRIY